MSLFASLFGSNAAPTSASAAPAQAPAATPVVQTDEQTQTTEPTGLDKFQELWQMPTQTPENTPAPVVPNLDPAKVAEAVSKIDFAKTIPAASLQAVAQGGEGAVTALAEILNRTAQSVFAQATLSNSKLLQQTMANARQSFLSELPTHIKTHNMQDQLKQDNPALSHPAAAPILGAVQQQLAVKFPQATATELSAMAKTYLTEFASVVSPQKQPQTQQPVSNEPDWASYLNQ